MATGQGPESLARQLTDLEDHPDSSPPAPADQSRGFLGTPCLCAHCPLCPLTSALSPFLTHPRSTHTSPAYFPTSLDQQNNLYNPWVWHLLYTVLWSPLVFSPGLWAWGRGARKAATASYLSLHLSSNTIKVYWTNVCVFPLSVFLSVNHELFGMLCTSSTYWESWRISCYRWSLPACDGMCLSNAVSQMQRGPASAISSVIPGRGPCLFSSAILLLWSFSSQQCCKVIGFEAVKGRVLKHCLLWSHSPGP